jgi:hypothetical protein
VSRQLTARHLEALAKVVEAGQRADEARRAERGHKWVVGMSRDDEAAWRVRFHDLNGKRLAAERDGERAVQMALRVLPKDAATRLRALAT